MDRRTAVWRLQLVEAGCMAIMLLLVCHWSARNRIGALRKMAIRIHTFAAMRAYNCAQIVYSPRALDICHGTLWRGSCTTAFMWANSQMAKCHMKIYVYPRAFAFEFASICIWICSNVFYVSLRRYHINWGIWNLNYSAWVFSLVELIGGGGGGGVYRCEQGYLVHILTSLLKYESWND